MDVPQLIRLNAALCVGLSLLAIAPVAFLSLAAPGYWRQLTLWPLLSLAFYLGFGVSGLCTVIGLLRHRAWARVSIVVLAAVWTLESIVTILALAMSHSGALFFIRPGVVGVVGLSWLVFFNAAQTREFFTKTACLAAKPQNLR